MDMKITAIVHVYYPELWPELATCIRNLGEGVRLIVTYGEGCEDKIAEAKRDFPTATYIPCEPRGYDIWPFLKALKHVDFDQTDLIVKLHTKRNVDISRKTTMGYTVLNGSSWRNHLLAFVRTPAAWAKSFAKFEDPSVGLVADRHVIFFRRDARKRSQIGSFDRALVELSDKWGIKADSREAFVGGTMFAVRAALYRPLAEFPFKPEMFEVSKGHETETYAHIMERILGLIVTGQGYKIVAFNGSVFWRRIGCRIRNLFYERRFSDRRETIRIFGVTVYNKHLSDD